VKDTDLTLYRSASSHAALVLGHGAGAGQKSPFMVRAGKALAERGLAVATFDFPYMAQGRKVPDKAEVLEAAWRTAIEAARAQLAGVPLFIGGKSMGGRIASQVAAQGGNGTLAGLVYLGYPLHPPGNPGKRRDAHLPRIAEPMLFVQGSRDTFGTADEIRSLLPLLQRAELHEVSEGDHGFKAPKRAGDPDAIMAGIMDTVATWTRSIVAR
jgi:predicted alpha/beta-hydrolase family hydrolase